MPFLDLADARLYYTVDGPQDAPPLVLSNSLGTHSGMWAFQVAALAQDYRIIRYDTRGHGLSSAAPGEYSFALLAGDVAALLAHLGVRRASFCGISMGGMTGLQLALSRPGLVDRLVLCNTAARIGSAESWSTRIDAVRAGTLAAMSADLVSRWLSDPFRAAEPGLVQVLCDMLARTPDEGYIANCAALRDGDLRARLGEIAQPTLIISGSEDQAATTAQAREMAQAMPEARHVDLPTSHISNWEQPALFTETLRGFLAP
ncbi:3-oxoadipate enol-lactonase [Acidimangrovimonas sediminis]|uniref:3-oxoadipate enol-lactonase n=1 Tax=Acidimangrovimonas sediminis TaxID=2056283 RepID=UPI000C7FA001|nr:3-oxoadipate enol-lactonase [Acidimangrovimonas sediminis]